MTIMSWFKKKQAVEVVDSVALPERSMSPVEFGNRAEAFMQSGAPWEFFVMLCQQVRDAHLNAEPGNDSASLQNHACACLMKSLPGKVKMLVYQRDRIKQNLQEQQNKAANRLAGRNGTRGASRPLSA